MNLHIIFIIFPIFLRKLFRFEYLNFSLVEDYIAAIDGVIEHLVHRTPNEKYVYIGELINGKDFKPVS